MEEKSFSLNIQSRMLAGQQDANLEAFGDSLAEREGYKVHDRMDAIHWFLVEKYHWKLSDVRSLNGEDLRFLMAEEMAGWTLPPALRDVPDSAISELQSRRASSGSQRAVTRAASGGSSKSPK
jgi:hypothetical protein